MFLGYIGLALAARRAAPRTSLGTLLLAAQALDAGWAAPLAARLQRAIVPVLTAAAPADAWAQPTTHTLAFAAVSALVLGLAYLAVRGYVAGAIVVATLVLGHWALDAGARLAAVMGWPDSAPLPLLGQVPVLLVVESGIFLGGAAVYLCATRARDRIGRWGLVASLVALPGCFAAAILVMPPLQQQALVLALLGTALFAPLAFWIERYRMPAGLIGPELMASRLGSRGLALGMFL